MGIDADRVKRKGSAADLKHPTRDTPIMSACTECSRCCKVPIAPVNDSDVRRLIKRTGLAADAVVHLYKPSDIDYDSTGDLWIKTPKGRRILGLKKLKKQCRFLGEDGRCSVYTSRPSTCRTYPYGVEHFENGDLESIELIDEIGCCGRIGRHWKVEQLIKDAKREDREDDAYCVRLRLWEAAGSRGGKKGLLMFLKLA